MPGLMEWLGFVFSLFGIAVSVWYLTPKRRNKRTKGDNVQT